MANFSVALLEEAERLREEGARIADIAKRFDVNYESLRSALLRRKDRANPCNTRVDPDEGSEAWRRHRDFVASQFHLFDLCKAYPSGMPIVRRDVVDLSFH